MSRQFTPWELRGYLAYPQHYGKPRPGSPEENSFSRGWTRAQEEDLLSRKSQYHLDLENDYWAGRESYAAQYGLGFPEPTVPIQEQQNFEF